MKYTKPNLTPHPQQVRDFLGENLIKLRKKAGLTQMRLASDAGLELSTVHRIESAKTDTSISTLARIRKAINCKWSDLLKDV
jgi:transcriptional regulator with XRE-family HTH domain